MDRADDAKKRLTALNQPIPRPTKAAVAQNRAEIASRSESTTVQKLMGADEERPGRGPGGEGGRADSLIRRRSLRTT